MYLKYGPFGGMIPALGDTFLPELAAARAVNTYLFSGELIGLPEPSLLYELTTPSSAKVFRIPETYDRPEYLFNSTWLEFADKDTDVVRGPVDNDTYDRYYWCSASQQPVYNPLSRIINSDNELKLGIPAPSAPSLNITGGTSPSTTRVYVCTFVSAYGEEGPPSDPVTDTGNDDGTWEVTLPAAAADDLDGTDRLLTKTRIYHTVASGSGALYYFVAEVDITDTTYDDTDVNADITGNGVLESTDWSAPPTDLKGFAMMPNGILAGFRSNEIWFSEPYRPHAWPARYVLTVEFPIVGLGIINQSLVVCTQGYPMTCTGSSPEYMTTSKLTAYEPCVSRGSIVSAPEGVYYASLNGLILVNPGRAENVTKKLITRDKWQQLTKLTQLRAAMYGSMYFAYGTATTGVFQQGVFQADMISQADTTGSKLGVLIDVFNQNVAFTLLESEEANINVIGDVWSNAVMLIRDEDVYYIDQSDPSPTYRSYLWRSKEYEAKEKINFSAVKVIFTVPENTPTQGVSPVVGSPQELASDQYALLRVYADRVLKSTIEIRNSGDIFRLPSGFKADTWQFEIEGRVRVMSLQIATSVKELSVA